MPDPETSISEFLMRFMTFVYSICRNSHTSWVQESTRSNCSRSKWWNFLDHYQSVLSTCILPLRLSKIFDSKKSPEILNMFGGKKLKDLTEEDRQSIKRYWISTLSHSIDCYMIWFFQVFLFLQTRGYSKFCFFICHQARRSATVVSFKLSVKRLRGHRLFCVYLVL